MPLILACRAGRVSRPGSITCFGFACRLAIEAVPQVQALDEFVHYAKLTGINAAVLHVKDPNGRIRWKSNNVQAAKIGAVASYGLVENALRQLKSQDFWTVAKLDVFVDHQLVTKRPDMGLIDSRTGKPYDQGLTGLVGSGNDSNLNPAKLGPGRTIKMGFSVGW